MFHCAAMLDAAQRAEDERASNGGGGAAPVAVDPKLTTPNFAAASAPPRKAQRGGIQARSIQAYGFAHRRR